MSDQLLDYFSRVTTLSEAERKAIADSMCVRTFPKDAVLLRQGEVAKDCYFVLEGCVRQYTLADGTEKTSGFFTESQWVVSLQSFLQQTPANHYFVCAEETTLVVGNAEKETALYDAFPRFETISRTVMAQMLAEQQEMLTTYVTSSPEQRYQELLRRRPDLLQRIPQYQLASYIGVRPESLSRIRKRITAGQG